MAATYGVRELYGGAMRVELPVDLIDSSDIRQIPDHQEVFLSPTTLTSIIFEINTYVNPSSAPTQNQPQSPSMHTSISQDGTTTTTTTSITTTSATVISGGGSATPQQPPPPPTPPQEALDAEAVKFHFLDVIAPPDTLVANLPTPQPVRMVDPSLSQFPAYMVAGNINTVDTRHPPPPPPTTQDRSPAGSSIAHANAPLASLVHQLQLLIRLPQYGTDLVVRVAVPLKEFAQAGQRLGGSVGGGSATEEMIAEELGRARDLVARVVGTLRVMEWGLFGN